MSRHFLSIATPRRGQVGHVGLLTLLLADSILSDMLYGSVVSMLIGSLPVVLLVAPCVIAGACMLRSSEGGVWPSLVGIALSGSALAQSVAMIAALYYIEGMS